MVIKRRISILLILTMLLGLFPFGAFGDNSALGQGAEYDVIPEGSSMPQNLSRGNTETGNTGTTGSESGSTETGLIGTTGTETGSTESGSTGTTGTETGTTETGNDGTGGEYGSTETGNSSTTGSDSSSSETGNEGAKPAEGESGSAGSTDQTDKTVETEKTIESTDGTTEIFQGNILSDTLQKEFDKAMQAQESRLSILGVDVKRSEEGEEPYYTVTVCYHAPSQALIRVRLFEDDDPNSTLIFASGETVANGSIDYSEDSYLPENLVAEIRVVPEYGQELPDYFRLYASISLLDANDPLSAEPYEYWNYSWTEDLSAPKTAVMASVPMMTLTALPSGVIPQGNHYRPLEDPSLAESLWGGGESGSEERNHLTYTDTAYVVSVEESEMILREGYLKNSDGSYSMLAPSGMLGMTQEELDEITAIVFLFDDAEDDEIIVPKTLTVDVETGQMTFTNTNPEEVELSQIYSSLKFKLSFESSEPDPVEYSGDPSYSGASGASTYSFSDSYANGTVYHPSISGDIDTSSGWIYFQVDFNLSISFNFDLSLSRTPSGASSLNYDYLHRVKLGTVGLNLGIASFDADVSLYVAAGGRISLSGTIKQELTTRLVFGQGGDKPFESDSTVTYTRVDPYNSGETRAYVGFGVGFSKDAFIRVGVELIIGDYLVATKNNSTYSDAVDKDGKSISQGKIHYCGLNGGCTTFRHYAARKARLDFGITLNLIIKKVKLGSPKTFTTEDGWKYGYYSAAFNEISNTSKECSHYGYQVDAEFLNINRVHEAGVSIVPTQSQLNSLNSLIRSKASANTSSDGHAKLYLPNGSYTIEAKGSKAAGRPAGSVDGSASVSINNRPVSVLIRDKDLNTISYSRGGVMYTGQKDVRLDGIKMPYDENGSILPVAYRTGEGATITVRREDLSVMPKITDVLLNGKSIKADNTLWSQKEINGELIITVYSKTTGDLVIRFDPAVTNVILNADTVQTYTSLTPAIEEARPNDTLVFRGNVTEAEYYYEDIRIEKNLYICSAGDSTYTLPSDFHIVVGRDVSLHIGYASEKFADYDIGTLTIQSEAYGQTLISSTGELSIRNVNFKGYAPYDMTYTDGISQNGRSLYLENVQMNGFSRAISVRNSTFSLTDVDISHCSTSLNGSGFCCSGCTGNIWNLHISDCYCGDSVNGGGGICILGNSSVEMYSAVIEDCSSYFYGGGIFLGQGSSLKAEGLTIRRCSATFSGGGIECRGTLELADSSNGKIIIENNKVDEKNSTGGRNSGGGIAVVNGGTLTLNGGEFRRNESKKGEAIFLGDCKLRVSGSPVFDQTLQPKQTIYMSGDYSVIEKAGDLAGNVILPVLLENTRSGRDILISSASQVVFEDENKILLKNSGELRPIYSPDGRDDGSSPADVIELTDQNQFSVSYVRGGVIYSADRKSELPGIDLSASSLPTSYVHGTAFSAKIVAEAGTGFPAVKQIKMNDNPVSMDGKFCKITEERTKNTVTVQFSEKADGEIFVYLDDAAVKNLNTGITYDTLRRAVETASEGDTLAVLSDFTEPAGDTLTINKNLNIISFLTGHTVQLKSSLAVTDGALVRFGIVSSDFSDCTPGMLTFEVSTDSDSQIPDASSVLTVSSGCTVNAQQLSLNGNNKNLRGIYLSSSCSFSMKKGTVENFSMTGSVSCGAGLYVCGGTALLSEVTFTGNSSRYNGGAIYVKGGTVGIENCDICSNNSYSGGGIYTYGGETIISNSRLCMNDGSNAGGAAEVYKGTMTLLENTLISGNHANYLGGGIDICPGSTLVCTSAEISGNTAGEEGSGIYNSGTLEITGGIVKGNAAYYDGAIYNSGICRISGGEFSDESGLAIRMTAGTLEMSGSPIFAHSETDCQYVFLGEDNVITKVGSFTNDVVIPVYLYDRIPNGRDVLISSENCDVIQEDVNHLKWVGYVQMDTLCLAYNEADPSRNIPVIEVSSPNVLNTTKNTGYSTLRDAVDAAETGDALLFLGDTVETAGDIAVSAELSIDTQGSHTCTLNGSLVIGNENIRLGSESEEHLILKAGSGFGGGLLTVNYNGDEWFSVPETVEIDGSSQNVTGILLSKGKCSIDGAEIRNCKGESQGGGITAAGGELRVSSGQFKDNTADKGAGIYLIGGSCQIFGTALSEISFSGNAAEEAGNAIYVGADASFEIIGSPVFHRDSDPVQTVDLSSGAVLIRTSDLRIADDPVIPITLEDPIEGRDVLIQAGGAVTNGMQNWFVWDNIPAGYVLDFSETGGPDGTPCVEVTIGGLILNANKNELYNQLSTAVDEAASGDTLVFMGDVTEKEPLTVDKDLYICSQYDQVWTAKEGTVISSGVSVTFGQPADAFKDTYGGTLTMVPMGELSEPMITNHGELTLGDFVLDGGDKAGDGGIVTDGTLTMNTGSLVTGCASEDQPDSGNSGNQTLYGGGITVTGGSATLSGGKITGNVANLAGGGVLVNGSATFTMTDGVIEENYAYYYGGGICVVNDGKFEFSGGSLIGNSARLYGGAGFVQDSTVEMTGGTIEENTSKRLCGGLYLAEGKDPDDSATACSITGGTFTGNSAGTMYGNAVYACSGAALEISGDPVFGGTPEKEPDSDEPDDDEPENNSPLKSAPNGSSDDSDDSSPDSAEMQNVCLSEGVSIQKNGLLNTTVPVVLENSELGRNVYESESGDEKNVIDEDLSGFIWLNPVNLETGEGTKSAKLVFTPIDTVTNGPVIEVYASDEPNPVYNANKGFYYGDLRTAVLAASAGDTLVFLGDVKETGSPITISKDLYICSYEDHTDTLPSGAYLNITDGVSVRFGEVGKEEFDEWNTGTLTLQTGETEDVKGHGIITANNASIGLKNTVINGSLHIQGLFLTGGSAKIHGTAMIINCRGINGGGIYADHASVTLTDDAAVAGNSADSGGGIYMLGGTLNLDGKAQVSQNCGNLSGGGITLSGDAVLQAEGNSAVCCNDASYGNGGGIFADGGKCILSGAQVSSNKAANGGGVYVSQSGTLTVSSGSWIHSNSAGNSGGGIFTVGNVSVQTGYISGNTAENSGGGIYAAVSGDADVNFGSGTYIQDNIAPHGGGVYNARRISAQGSVQVNGNYADSDKKTDNNVENNKENDAVIVILGPLSKDKTRIDVIHIPEDDDSDWKFITSGYEKYNTDGSKVINANKFFVSDDDDYHVDITERNNLYEGILTTEGDAPPIPIPIPIPVPPVPVPTFPPVPTVPIPSKDPKPTTSPTPTPTEKPDDKKYSISYKRNGKTYPKLEFPDLIPELPGVSLLTSLMPIKLPEYSPLEIIIQPKDGHPVPKLEKMTLKKEIEGEKIETEIIPVVLETDQFLSLSYPLVIGDITVELTPEVTVTFDSNGGTHVDSQLMNKDDKAFEPKEPEKRNCYFQGWYLDNGSFSNAYNFNTPVTEDITLYAKWVRIPGTGLDTGQLRPFVWMAGISLAVLGGCLLLSRKRRRKRE
ncbi:MAG: InlB B-repeat-containing protein [Eubacteriales bacterium]|nr:InlB B-repeat-containing protein [Eubacteriales bacterium]